MNLLKEQATYLKLLYKSKSKRRHETPFFLGEDESIWSCIEAVRTCFCHMRDLKQREKVSSGHVVFCIAATYM